MAFHDQWAALGSAYLLADGPVAAQRSIECFEATTHLMDWAFAEGGFLLDFDQQKLIAFGVPEPMDLDALDELAGMAEMEGIEDFEGLEDLCAAAAGGMTLSFDSGPEAFLSAIAPRRPGWLLVWDERGVDAFTEHLRSRRITSIATEEPSTHSKTEICTVQA